MKKLLTLESFAGYTPRIEAAYDNGIRLTIVVDPMTNQVKYEVSQKQEIVETVSTLAQACEVFNRLNQE